MTGFQFIKEVLGYNRNSKEYFNWAAAIRLKALGRAQAEDREPPAWMHYRRFIHQGRRYTFFTLNSERETGLIIPYILICYGSSAWYHQSRHVAQLSAFKFRGKPWSKPDLETADFRGWPKREIISTEAIRDKLQSYRKATS